MKKAFTLIELLIVVAIIAILAAIAVPNFLEAQTRSKVARVKSDLRTYATAIESYAVDHNKPPREANLPVYGASSGDTEYNAATNTQGPLEGNISNVLSTPVAYITVARIKDTFQDKNLNTALDQQYYTYWDMRSRAATNPTLGPNWGTLWYRASAEFYGDWRLIGVGPDRAFFHPMTGSANLAYDPTNGTISLGNLHRSQKLNDTAQPAPGLSYAPGSVLLGAH